MLDLDPDPELVPLQADVDPHHYLGGVNLSSIKHLPIGFLRLIDKVYKITMLLNQHTDGQIP